MKNWRLKLRYSRLGIAWLVFRGHKAIIGLGTLDLAQDLDGVLVVNTTLQIDYCASVCITNCETVNRGRVAIEIPLPESLRNPIPGDRPNDERE